MNDAHCHFFSPAFYTALGRQKGWPPDDAGQRAVEALGWEAPASPEALADRWAEDLARRGVSRAVMIASVHDDGASVARAVRRHPATFIGAFMHDPTAPDADRVLREALEGPELRMVCVFPALHRFSLGGDEMRGVLQHVATRANRAVFVHCGALTIGARRRLGLPSVYEFERGNPLALQPLASRFPEVPFIVPHFGAGFLREALMLGDACPNVHVDTSSSNGWLRYHPGLELRDVFARVLDVFGAGRVLFGTDSSFFPRGWQTSVAETQQAALDSLGVDAATMSAIFTTNVDRLFPAPAQASPR